MVKNKKPSESLANLCRTCMSTTNVQAKSKKNMQSAKQNIFEKIRDCKHDYTITELLLMVQPQIQILPEDYMPKTMCIGCIHMLQTSYEFIHMYKESDEKFRKLLNDIEWRTNEISEDSKDLEETLEFLPETPLNECDNSIETKIEIDECSIEKFTKDSDPEFEGMLINDVAFEDDNSDASDNPFSDASADEDWQTKGSKKSPAKKSGPKKTIAKTKKVSSVSKANKQSKEKKNSKLLPAPPLANEDGSLNCQECEMLLNNKILWDEHMLKHHAEKVHKKSDKKSFECEYCGKVFPRIGFLNIHVRKHTGEKPFLCMECGKSFKNHNTLNIHMLRHKGEKNFQCTQCPKNFVCRSGLYSHMKQHGGEKPYICDICGGAFQMPYMLKKHRRYHDNIKDFPCEYCDKCFFTNEQARRHMRTHTGEKPYRCKYCDRAYAQSNDCNKHMKQHLGDNIFQCEFCPLRFPLARELRIHFATHKDDDEETRARHLKERDEDERNLKIKFGVKEDKV